MPMRFVRLAGKKENKINVTNKNTIKTKCGLKDLLSASLAKARYEKKQSAIPGNRCASLCEKFWVVSYKILYGVEEK